MKLDKTLYAALINSDQGPSRNHFNQLYIGALAQRIETDAQFRQQVEDFTRRAAYTPSSALRQNTI